jgi:hypothetical protein
MRGNEVHSTFLHQPLQKSSRIEESLDGPAGLVVNKLHITRDRASQLGRVTVWPDEQHAPALLRQSIRQAYRHAFHAAALGDPTAPHQHVHGNAMSLLVGPPASVLIHL